MLRRLKYSVTFPSNNRTLEADVQFGEGFTAITGPNEVGKSMVFEMTRFLLFGTDALRGPADDYKNLKCEGEFVIRGNIVELSRTINKATMKRNGEVVATGVKPVNAKVLEELGFGLAVFDIACSINQGEVERLGGMRPMQRKAMVDSVLGLSALDNVAKWAVDEAKVLERQAESIHARLALPGPAPEEPAGYRLITEEELEQARAEAEELAEITGFLSVEKSKPVKPTCEVELPAANLRTLADQRRGAREKVASLQARIAALPAAAPHTSQELSAAAIQWGLFHEYEANARWLAQNPRPKWASVTQLKVFEDDYVALENLAKFDHYNMLIERQLAVGTKPCPHCGEAIPIQQDQIEQLKAERDALVIPRDNIAPPAPPIVRKDIPAAIRELQSWDEAKFNELSKTTLVQRPTIAEHEIPKFAAMIDQVAERTQLQGEWILAKAAFDKMADYEAMLAEREAYERALAAHVEEQRSFLEWQAERDTKTARKAALAGANDRYVALRQDASAFRVYEAEFQRWRDRDDAYVLGLGEATRLEADAEEHRKVREVMNVLRGLIKQHVLPSLNVVASHLLRQMTGGQRNLIHIDDDFNVVVDRQNLETLSGSGKACANLAIRIALGQVLTNKVISILLADEIDASMDSFRAEKTSNVLWMLEDSVSQLLLVSHKPVDAPHHVRLGDQYGIEADL